MKYWFATREWTTYVVLNCLLQLSSSLKSNYVIVGVPVGTSASFLSGFRPTFEDYLNAEVGRQFNPPISFTLKFADFVSVFTMVESAEADFVYVSPNLMSCFQSEFDIAPILTLRNFRQGIELNRYGGVIFARADNMNVKSVKDLKGRTILGTSILLAQFQWKVFADNGLSLMQDSGKVLFLAQGMSQNDVVFDVLSGIADAGFVRTDLLESLDRLGQINRSALRVLDRVANLSAADGRPFPFESSTALYPEYALGVLPRVDWAVVRAVQGALQRINASSPAARAGLYSTFQPPLSYFALRSLQESLGILGYDDSLRDFKCIRSTDAYGGIVCPVGFVKLPREAVQGGCAESGQACPLGRGVAANLSYTCICKPCALVRAFTVKSIRFSANAAGTANEVRLSLQTNVDLRSGAVEVAGLSGLLDEQGPVVLASPLRDGAAGIFCGDGDGPPGTAALRGGLLKLVICTNQTLRAWRTYELALVARNAPWAETATAIFVSASGFLTIDSVAMYSAPAIFSVVVPAPSNATAGGTGSTCGDGAMGGLEECDDGNTRPGDGCSTACQCEDRPCRFETYPDSNLASLLQRVGPGTTLLLRGGAYHQCYLVVASGGVSLQAPAGDVHFDCGVVGGATIVLWHTGFMMYSIRFDGLTLIAAASSVSARLVGVNVSKMAIPGQAAIRALGSRLELALVGLVVRDNAGGGIVFNSSGGLLKMQDCQFADNIQSYIDGGAVRIVAGNTEILRSRFVNNTAARCGGGIAFNGGRLTIANCSFERNQAAANGGALFFDAGQGMLELNNSEFVENLAGKNGGGLYNALSDQSTVLHSVFRENRATSGGGMFLEGARLPVTVQNCSMDFNTAGNDGGAIKIYNGMPSESLVIAIFIGNSASHNKAARGGGLSAVGPGLNLLLKSCLFSSNNAVMGGGIASFNSVMTVLDSNFKLNSAARGAAAWFEGLPGSSLTMNSSAFEENHQIDGSSAQVLCSVYSNASSSCSEAGISWLFTLLQTASESLGGALVVTGSSNSWLYSCSFKMNSAAFGGAVCVTGSASVTLSNSTFLNNFAQFGGGVLVAGAGIITITRSQFEDNSAMYGGSVSVSGNGAVHVIESNIFGGKALAGGCFFVDGSASAYFLDSRLSSCQAEQGGGVSASSFASVTLNASRIEFCTAKYGSATFVEGAAALAIFSSRFTLNVASECGTITLNTTEPIAVSGTTWIERNIAEKNGGAICVLVRNESSKQCPLAASQNLLYGNVSLGKIFINSNRAARGGGAIFWNCIGITNPALALSRLLTLLSEGYAQVDNNTAGYGPLVAALAESLDHVTNRSDQYSPGDIFDSNIRLKDSFDQTVKDMTKSIPNILAILLCKTSGGECGFLLGAATSPNVLALSLHTAQPDGIFVAVKEPTQVPWPLLESSDLAPYSSSRVFEPMLHVSFTIFDPVEDVVIPALLMTITRLPCSRQLVYDPSLRVCTQCSLDNYITDSDHGICLTCPAGGLCNGSSLRPAIASSVWSKEEGLSGIFHIRLQSCPAGYILVRVEPRPEMDECVPCPFGKYSLDSAVLGGKLDLVASSAINAVELCLQCSNGVACLGGSNVISQPGYFLATTGAVGYQSGRRESTTNYSTATRTLLAVYKCPLQACTGNNSCDPGRTGIICGLCEQGYAQAGHRCFPCSQERSQFDLTLYTCLGIILVALFLYVCAWRTLFDIFNIADSNKFGESTSFARISRMLNIFVDQARQLVAGYSLLEYGKIIISHAQISSSFLTSFDVDWPSNVQFFMQQISVLKFDVMSYPGPNCLVSKMSYTEKYLSYFVSPLAISAALVLPSLYVMTYGLLFHGKIHAHPKFEDTVTLFLQSFLFFSLAIYPTISSIALAVFNCDNQLGLLKADYTQACLGNGSNGELTWIVVLSVIIYPIGSPLLMLGLLLWFRIPHIAAQKHDQELLRALIAKFQASQPPAVARLAKYVGSAKTDATEGDEISLKAQAAFDAIHPSQEGADQCIVGEQVELLFSSFGLDVSDMGHLHGDFTSGKGNHYESTIMSISIGEFELMLQRALKLHSLFNGHETYAELSKDQLHELVIHPWREAGSISIGSEARKRIFKIRMGSAMLMSHSAALERKRKGEAGLEWNLETAGDNDADEDSMQSEVKRIARGLVQRNLLVMPPVIWDRTGQDDEQVALKRAGVLFEAFQVDYWFFQLLENLRRLYLISVVPFISTGSTRLSAAFLVLLLSLLWITLWKPYTSTSLNNLQIVAITVQILTVFYGIMIEMDAAFILHAAEANAVQSPEVGPIAVSTSSGGWPSYVIVVINICVPFVPIFLVMIDVMGEWSMYVGKRFWYSTLQWSRSNVVSPLIDSQRATSKIAHSQSNQNDEINSQNYHGNIDSKYSPAADSQQSAVFLPASSNNKSNEATSPIGFIPPSPELMRRASARSMLCLSDKEQSIVLNIVSVQSSGLENSDVNENNQKQPVISVLQQPHSALQESRRLEASHLAFTENCLEQPVKTAIRLSHDILQESRTRSADADPIASADQALFAVGGKPVALQQTLGAAKRKILLPLPTLSSK